MKVESQTDKTGKNKLKFAFRVLTLFAALLTAVVAFLVYRINIDENFDKKKDEEVSVFTHSVECSLSHCGSQECSEIYTTRYPGGAYYKAAMQASESGKSLLICSSPKDIQNTLSKIVNQAGKGNQSNSGGINYQSVK